jgi:hypothetical protein
MSFTMDKDGHEIEMTNDPIFGLCLENRSVFRLPNLRTLFRV